MIRRAARFRLVPVAAAAWAVAAATTLTPGIAPAVAWSCWAIALAGVGVLALRRPRTRIGIIAVLTLAAAAAAASHVALAQPSRSALDAMALDGGRAVAITADVVGKVERRATGELAFDALATRIAAGPVATDVHVEVVVRIRPGDVDRLAALEVGSTVLVNGTTYPAQPGDRAVLVVAARSLEVVAPASGAAAVASGLRRGLLGATVGLPQPGAGLVPGLAVGDTSRVGPELDTAMKRSSLSHLTAVSGANCALVVGIAFGAAALAGLGRRVRVGCGVAALAGFVVLVTPEPSVVRAAAMAGAAMLAVLLGRPAVGMSVLSLAVALLMIADPWLSTSLGFALSAAATAALLVAARPLAVGLARWMPRALALALAVPLAAQLACGPLLVLIAPSVPVYGVIANLLAAPAAPAATLVGLAACLAQPLPWLQSGLAAIAWVPASWIAATARLFSGLPGGQLPWLEGWWGAAVLAACGFAVGIVVLVRARARGWPRALRFASVLLVAATAGVSVGTTVLTTASAVLTVPGQWAILACDIGQGDAVLVRSAGHVALIDTGPEPARLAACLDKTAIARIDLLVLTHYDADHRGGLDAVIGHVDTVVHGPPVTDADRAVLAALERGGATLTDGRSGLHGRLGGAAWRVIWPVGESRGFPGGNDAGVVVEFTGGGVPASVFLADLSAAPQRAIVAGALARQVDVVKVAHHGSADQDPELYRLLSPTVALISVGADNDYGHPRPETIAFLEAAGVAIARTDQFGIVALWSTPDGVAVWRERAGDVRGAG
ncbi:ComEC/Rec2 family competence protein [Microbacterium sp. P5_E9]